MQSTEDYKTTEYNTEINSIKEAIKDIAKRLANLNQEAVRSIRDNSDEWKNALSAIKNKIMKDEQDIMRDVSSYIKENPLQSAVGCFISGIVLAMFLPRKQ